MIGLNVLKTPTFALHSHVALDRRQPCANHAGAAAKRGRTALPAASFCNSRCLTPCSLGDLSKMQPTIYNSKKLQEAGGLPQTPGHSLFDKDRAAPMSALQTGCKGLVACLKRQGHSLLGKD